MNPFDLHPQLAQDCFDLEDWPLCRVLRFNDRTYPWLILVPMRTELREIIDLSPDNQQRLMAEIARASRAMRDLANPDKLNVATLGNMVPQLHVHVIGRRKNDPAWPKPVWGVGRPDPFAADAIAAERESWRKVFAVTQ
jgi:diadenosine tetraphosphate (Ap4A) HIT family hydrolase